MPKQIDVYVYPEEEIESCQGCMFRATGITCPNDAVMLCSPSGSNPGIIFKTEPPKPVFTVKE